MTNAWLFVHLAGVFGFLVAHGVSATVGLKLRKERDPVRARALLDLSATTLNLANISFVVLLAGGLGAASSEHVWSDGWPWAAIGVLLALLALVPTLVVPYYKQVRRAVGAPGARGRMPAGEPASAREIERVLSSPVPIVISVTGVAALAILLWLMVYKPF